MEDFKKYFDPTNYSTKLIAENDDVTSKKPLTIVSTLISLLTEQENRAFKEEALLILKKEKAGNLLIDAINKSKKNKHILVAACWESEIDFSNQLSFFVTLASDNDYLVSLEAITVISTMLGSFNVKELKDCIEKIKIAKEKTSTERLVLLNDLIITLQGFL